MKPLASMSMIFLISMAVVILVSSVQLGTVSAEDVQAQLSQCTTE